MHPQRIPRSSYLPRTTFAPSPSTTARPPCGLCDPSPARLHPSYMNLHAMSDAAGSLHEDCSGTRPCA
ncbi:hypothetical protein DAEQUDRAFT_723457 [Daedalea quercina L-15889]|uniref:Uncharacterized protein n=1 Tax=Daedalea quercina L-15889 TaxID=1314783 RepID=A0A165SE07_9APHY|nr:hypothetical protein DAEQUDRAFT_723457 [Daedalea quercina L-15889]